MLKAAYRIAWKDVMGDFRRRATLSAMLFFAISVLIVFQAALEPNRQEALRLMPGLLWITVLFTSLVGLGRVFQAEEEDGALEGLLMAPVPRGIIFLGKWWGNLILTILVEILLLPMMMILLNVDAWDRVHLIFGILLLGTLGLTGLGVLLAAMTQTARSRETLLALLLIPLVVPLLIAGVQATSAVLGTVTDSAAWLQLMIIFDVVYLALVPWAFGWLVEE
ncbi:cytochrome c-type biogenesis protein CcmB [Magnetococcus marinus MC-1]|uniref:Heme exporter protein B n=1 Tax=Magnetococcus marinus (strain ATCC BAA-1437 / JCM 17883 / MC-1) TaxID=156889 RepID=A0LDE1_MAGMM|nr:heme exporter protein CcmB [Magnetococcus marinus]ABK45984.1 cytochrome c-type biogenesis protein CcmB [Magnetococcus marinus MC-1]